MLNMPNHRYRCTRRKCSKRVTLSKLKELFVKEQVCKVCGSPIRSVEKERKAYTRKMKCTCDGLHFIHQRGSRWCIHFKGEYSEEELMERHLI